MKILVTGGTGVIGEGVIPELIARGHSVRLLSRHAGEDSKQWKGVEAFDGDLSRPESLAGAAAGCDAVLHVAGIVKEQPPELTFKAINVDGTQHVIDEMRRAGVARLVYVSSLGADRGESAYHRSKREAEVLVERSDREWVIVRPGNVYGPGDEVISTILKMVRALPVVPVIADGTQEFQPIWYQDLGRVLAESLERVEVSRQTLEAGGAEITSMNDLLERFAEITDRTFLRVPVPMPLAHLATRVSVPGMQLPVDEQQLTMLEEKNVVRGRSAMDTFGITPTPLDQALKTLADAIPEQLPEEGFGSMEHKRFWADIRGSKHTPASLMDHFRRNVSDVMPIEFAAEPDVAEEANEGETLTGAIPGRGNIQVRVEVSEPTHVVFATVEGHPLAGIVEFTASPIQDAIRFSVEVHARAANFFDWVGMKTVGRPAQNATWRTVVQRMVDASGGSADSIEESIVTLDDAEAQQVEKRVRELVQRRKREESAAEHAT